MLLIFLWSEAWGRIKVAIRVRNRRTIACRIRNRSSARYPFANLSHAPGEVNTRAARLGAVPDNEAVRPSGTVANSPCSVLVFAVRVFVISLIILSLIALMLRP
jgi:hypothetical protein